MKVAVLFDGASALGKSPDLLILEAVESVENAMASAGHEVIRIPANPDGRWMERVRKAKLDLVYNLCESVDGVAALEPAVIGALELLGVPFTGSSSATTSLCLRKHRVNALLDRVGLARAALDDRPARWSGAGDRISGDLQASRRGCVAGCRAAVGGAHGAGADGPARRDARVLG